MIDYFLIGLKSMMKSSVLTFAIYFISFLPSFTDSMASLCHCAPKWW